MKLSKKILAKFSYPKKIPESKISNPKKSFDHPCHLKSRVPPLPLGLHIMATLLQQSASCSSVPRVAVSKFNSTISLVKKQLTFLIAIVPLTLAV